MFRLSADVLRAAAGEVRCGRCGQVFNALRNLAEEPAAFARGDSPMELESRADDILENAGTEAGTASIQVEEGRFEDAPIASDEVTLHLESSVSARPSTEMQRPDPSMEFTLPPGELDRIFVQPDTSVARVSRRPGKRTPSPTARSPAESAPATASTSKSPSADSLRDSAAGDDLSAELVSSSEESSESGPYARLSPAMIEAAGAHAKVTLAEEIAEPAAQEVPSTDSIEVVTPEAWDAIEETREPHNGWWTGAAIFLTLLLMVQWVHGHRQSLADRAGIGETVRLAYAVFGAPIPLRTNLAAFEVRQWGVTGDVNANGLLRMRASIINTAQEPQPYPLLRLTLADRFGTRIGIRDFEPAEYLKAPPLRPLEPGERADAVIEIVDPGKNAEGFEIDVCTRMGPGTLKCANDAPVRAKP